VRIMQQFEICLKFFRALEGRNRNKFQKAYIVRGRSRKIPVQIADKWFQLTSIVTIGWRFAGEDWQLIGIVAGCRKIRLRMLKMAPSLKIQNLLERCNICLFVCFFHVVLFKCTNVVTHKKRSLKKFSSGKNKFTSLDCSLWNC